MQNPEVKILSPNSQLSFVTGWYDLASADHFWMKGRLAALLKQFKNNGIPTDRVLRGLEIGCGHGVLRAQIEGKTQWIIDGCDLDLVSLKNNPPAKGNIFLYNIFDRLDFLKSYYDFIILYDVIEHIEDVTPFVDACLFHLKPGGYVFFNVPALDQLYSVYDKVVGHHRRYDKPMMTETLKSCGLKAVHLNYWGLSFFPILKLRQQLLKNAPENKVVEKGFRPPGALINTLLSAMIHSEIALLPNPFTGTSLMAIARK